MTGDIGGIWELRGLRVQEPFLLFHSVHFRRLNCNKAILLTPSPLPSLSQAQIASFMEDPAQHVFLIIIQYNEYKQLKVDGTKNERGREEHSYSAIVWHLALASGAILNLNLSFLCKTHYFRFRWLQLFN
jgi:hypothetical protein